MLAAARDRFLAEDLLRASGKYGKPAAPTPQQVATREYLAKTILLEQQAGREPSKRETAWFSGYVRPDGTVARHYSTVRWEDFRLGGRLRRRLERAYAEWGGEGLDDAAARISDDLGVPLREVYTLFWS